MCIMLHTVNPNSDEVTVCCKRLIEKHPVLKDTEGSGYVTHSELITWFLTFTICDHPCDNVTVHSDKHAMITDIEFLYII